MTKGARRSSLESLERNWNQGNNAQQDNGGDQLWRQHRPNAEADPAVQT
jgi:hypothetical protein